MGRCSIWFGGKALGLEKLIKSGPTRAGRLLCDDSVHGRGNIRRDAILEAYDRLGSGQVAVRSSATAEDLADGSFAGELDTFRN